MLKTFGKFFARCNIFVLALSSILVGVMPATLLAQETTPEPLAGAEQSGIRILWPLPVSEVWDITAVIGTANVPGMAYYYLEYLPLNDDLSMPESAPWLPATTAQIEPVTNGILATLDTNKVTDGLYALRLVVNTTVGQSYSDTVVPIRVSNERYHSDIERLIRLALINAGIQPTATPEAPTTSPTAVPSNKPVVVPSEGYTAVNVRRCDSTDNTGCPIVSYLYEGQSAQILGISSTGSGWYQVRLPSGLIGWVSPTVVDTQGDLSGVPSVAPPAPLPPPSAASVTVNGISPQGTPTCAVPFNVNVNVANVGNATSQPGSVTLQDVNVSTGEITYTGYGSYPAISAGGNYVTVIPVTTTVYYNQTHELRAYVGNQTVRTQYTLAQGSCGVAPTAVPVPTAQPREVVVDESENGQTVTLKVGDTLIVKLNANVDAGYGWSQAVAGHTALRFVSGPTTIGGGAPGAPAYQQFVYLAVAAGQDLVELNYLPPDGGAAASVYQLPVVVN